MKSNALGNKIKSSTWQTWLGQWTELLNSGMPAVDALLLSSELINKSAQGKLLQTGLTRTSKYLQEGQNLQTAFRASFGNIPMHLEISITCAQASGDLGAALQIQLDRWKTTSEAQRALGQSLIYPLLVLLLACACWVLLHQVSAPHLDELTTAAKETIKWADLLLSLGTLMLSIALFSRFGRSHNSREGAPLLPSNTWLSSNFYHVIGCELHAGLDLIYCLRHRNMPTQRWPIGLNLTKKTLQQLNILMLDIQLKLKLGMSLSQAMKRAGAPDFLVRQSQLAEQTGNLAYCFFLASKVYEMRAREIQQKLQSTLPTIALAIAALTLAMAYQFTLAPLYDNLTGIA